MYDARKILPERWRQRMAQRNAIPVADIRATGIPSLPPRAPLAPLACLTTPGAPVMMLEARL